MYTVRGRAVVTGGGRGIGAAIVERLRNDNYEVFPLDIESGDGITVCDIADASSVIEVAEQIGRIDVLVNNAGIWLFSALEDVTESNFSKALSVNLCGPFNCIQAFGKGMLEQGSGCIVNVVSIAARHVTPATGSYSPSKAALVSLTEQVALEWGPKGVRCNAVGPGLVPTPGTGNVYDDPQIRTIRSNAVPLRRLAEPSDIANAIAFLVSEDASYINGQTIYVDGGLSASLMPLIPRPENIPQ